MSSTATWRQPLANLSPEERRALQYWGPIESVTLRGGSTEDLWAAINAHAEALGYPSAQISATAINRLRTRAVGNREAMDRLGQLGPDDLITGRQIGRAPWERGLDKQNAMPMWQVQFEHIVEVDGQQISVYRTTMFQGTVPTSRRELELAIEEDAIELANRYGQEHVGIGSYRILAT